MSIPADLKYTKEHEWARLDGDIITVGITDYAQGELGDIVYIELPEVGESVEQDESFGTIEAVKAVSDLYAPLSGEIVAVNDKLDATPDLVNSDPYGDGWMIKMKLSSADDYTKLLTNSQYEELL